MRKGKVNRKQKAEINIVSPPHYVSFIRKLMNCILLIVERENTEINIHITNDDEIRKLNKKYRKKDKPTDVLSFPINEFIEDIWIAGDIVISLDTAKKQAKIFGYNTKEELKRLLVHGFVHLLGYDHEKGMEEEKKFYELEKSILQKLDHL